MRRGAAAAAALRVAWLGLWLMAADDARAGHDLVVTVSGVQEAQGLVRGLLWTEADGFPDDPRKAVGRADVPATDASVTLIFRDVGPGRYAVSVIHDANENETLDTNFIGVPKEGVGISNDAIGMMGPRDFEEALIEVGASGSKIAIEFRYW